MRGSALDNSPVFVMGMLFGVMLLILIFLLRGGRMTKMEEKDAVSKFDKLIRVEAEKFVKEHYNEPSQSDVLTIMNAMMHGAVLAVREGLGVPRRGL
jgi:hypothetical protein